MTTVDCLKVLVQALFLSKTLNLVVIVLKYERCFDPIEQKILKTVIGWQNISSSSNTLWALNLLKEARKKEIEQFKKDDPSIAKLIGKEYLQ